ncbi:MAG: putative sugar O-methyltransferase [Candidatus Acidiferrales bacterium]
MLKLKHLQHPLRTASLAKDLITAHWNLMRLEPRGKRRYGEDVRYDLRNVTAGFAPRGDDRGDDTALLERICKAYIRATDQEPCAKQAYQATAWWQSVRKASLEPVRRALAAGDVKKLRGMYQNFFRDPCSAGLIGVPLRMARAYSGKEVHDVYRRFFLSDALHRIDYWKEQTGGRFDLRNLAGPNVGNPFGALIEGTFVRTGAEYQHYCAQRISGLLPTNRACVVEIGGGYGGMAYYLLRDRPAVRYIDFDVPESLALTAYYLLKSLPHLSFVLYGEEKLTQEEHGESTVILMPVFELGKVPAKSVDLAFSSHTMSNLSGHAVAEYLKEIARMTRKSFLYTGEGAAGVALPEFVRLKYPGMALREKRLMEWNRQRFMNANEVECVYEIGERGAASA